MQSSTLDHPHALKCPSPAEFPAYQEMALLSLKAAEPFNGC